MTPSQRLQAQRAAQQAADETLARDLARRYGVAWETVKRELETITARIQAARAAGTTVDEAWLLRQGVLDRLAQAVQHETQVYVEHATGKIGEAQAVQQQMGAAHASALVQATTPTAFRPLAAILERTTMGGPLALLLEQIAPAAANAARDALVAAVVAGDNPHTTARALRDTLEAPLWRTLRIARTETIGAYRDAATATYRANRTTLAGWTWIAQLSPRTCAACWAMHGTVHPLDEPLASHPNCRCTPAPLTKSWADLGFPGLDEERQIVLTARTAEQVEARIDKLNRRLAPTVDHVAEGLKEMGVGKGERRSLAAETRRAFSLGEREKIVQDEHAALAAKWRKNNPGGGSYPGGSWEDLAIRKYGAYESAGGAYLGFDENNVNLQKYVQTDESPDWYRSEAESRLYASLKPLAAKGNDDAQAFIRTLEERDSLIGLRAKNEGASLFPELVPDGGYGVDLSVTVKQMTLRPKYGPEVFARQPADVQLRVLGSGKFAAYRAGELALEDLVQPTLHPVWGPGIRERALRDVLAG